MDECSTMVLQGCSSGGVKFRAPYGANNQLEPDAVIHAKKLHWSVISQ